MKKDFQSRLAQARAAKVHQVDVAKAVKNGVPVVKPGTSFHTFVYQAPANMPPEKTFRPGYYWIRTGSQEGIKHYSDFAHFEAEIRKFKFDFCGPLPKPQDIVNGRAVGPEV